MLVLADAQGQGGCVNTIMYPGAATAPDPGGAVTTISTCSYEQEYSEVSNIVAGASYQFLLSTGGYITVHQDTYDGPIVGQGYSPVVATAATSGNLFAHWNTDDLCGTAINCATTTVQLLLNCIPASVTYQITEDCASSTFSITVNVLNTGDGATVTLSYNQNGGAFISQPGLSAGTYVLGPFPNVDIVDLVVAHEFDPACNVTYNDLAAQGNCPILIDCALPELNVSYCYPNNMNETWHYQSSGGQPLAILFSSGTIESVTWDELYFYDGPDDTYPLIWSHTQFSTFDLSGLLIVSTGPDIFMKASSDASVSCQSGSMQTWVYTVGCLDCDPTTTEFEVIPDCVHRTFQVAVNVDSLGSATAVNIYDTYSGDTLFNIPAGTTLLGPFEMGNDSTKVTVFNNDNTLCRVVSPYLGYDTDTCIVDTCGSANYSWCYQNSDTAWFAYASTQNVPITIRFLSGDLGPNDKVLFYNGNSVLSAVIFFGNNGGDMSNFALNSANVDNTLTFVVMSDGAGSCQDGQYDNPLTWDVQCGAVGVEELKVEGFRVYPNPTDGVVYLQMADGSALPLSVVVLDVAGRQVLSVPANNLVAGYNTIDLGGLANGQYMIQVTTEGQLLTQRIMVAR
ncbi:MAG: T9SS type A sorting domain-containing protein [Flavobacteriales bacterium]|nr:T9SS type A sorting domain-containing protein [Flavobacteriales bacterium]